MGKRRTRNDKQHARHQASSSAAAPLPEKQHAETVLINTTLIRYDLWKSVIISGLIIAIEFGIYWYLLQA